jgi:hypothetical protein
VYFISVFQLSEVKEEVKKGSKLASLVEVICYAQDDSFCIPIVSSSTQCFFRDFNRALVLEHPRTSCQQRWLFRLRLSEAKNFPFNFIL